jgi:hypothetical protein
VTVISQRGLALDTALSHTQAVLNGLKGAQAEVRAATVPVMRQFADEIAAQATANARQHPSGLWRNPKGSMATPRYLVSQVGTYWFRVRTPSGVAGVAESMSEFVSAPRSRRGASLVDTLTYTYGHPGGSGGGRILWAARDSLDSEFADKVQTAVDAAAGTIEETL